MLTSLLLLLAVEAAAAAPAPVAEPDPAHMDAAQMKAFNASVPATHPFHIRCRRDLETGSLVRVTKICRTNKQWTQADVVGNDNARETMDRTSSKAANGQF